MPPATRAFSDMLAHGAAAEVEALLARDLDPSLPAMRALGVRELASWLVGKIDRDDGHCCGATSDSELC